MSKLLHNLPVEDLTEENDYLGIIEKGEIIKSFLESNTDEFSQIKMFSLYGEWGSGKSTLMKYLQKELKETFNTYFFEAWQFEKDDNLSISLLEYLLEKSNTVGEEVAKDILKYGGKLLRGLGNSVQFNVPLYPTGPSIGVNPSKFVDEFTKVEDVTFYKALEKFKEDFVRWEDLKNGRKDKKYSIVFIDDLDRCEPENVLNLLSALKLFFTYGKKTIFMCGIDKKAVNEAVKTKYREVVKANEYLEKIFDISFNMPKYNDVFKLVDFYFKDLKNDFNDKSLSQNISEFFIELNFTNPRKIKKVLNKFLVLKSIGKTTHNSIPNYIDTNGGNYFETIITLYFILAIEFNYKIFDSIFNLKEKQEAYYNSMKNNLDINSLKNHSRSLELLISNNYIDMPLRVFNNESDYRTVIFTFLPLDAKLPHTSILNSHLILQIRTKVSIEYKFFKYLLNNKQMFDKPTTFSDLTLKTLKDIIEKII